MFSVSENSQGAEVLQSVSSSIKSYTFGVTWPYTAPDTHTHPGLWCCAGGKAPCNNEQWDIVKMEGS